MSGLSPKAAELVRGGRTALHPSPADEQRVSSALRTVLGEGVLPVEGAVSSSLLGPTWAKLVALGAAVGIAGGGAFVALRDGAPASDVVVPPPAQVQPALPPPVAQPIPAPQVEPRASDGPSAPEPSAVSTPRTADRLAQEVAILSRATRELHAGRPANALRAAEEHQRKFPNGVLTQERRAARVQALCALGRRADAEPELDRLTRLAPQSPNTLRAKQVCGAAAKPAR